MTTEDEAGKIETPASITLVMPVRSKGWISVRDAVICSEGCYHWEQRNGFDYLTIVPGSPSAELALGFFNARGRR